MHFSFKTQFGRCIYTSSEGFKVSQNYWYRWLTIDDTLQTLIHRKHPHRPQLPYMDFFIKPITMIPGPVCLMGLGGGGLVHALESIPHPLVVVDNQSAIIAIAKEYFLLDRTKVDVIEENAAIFLQHYQQPFRYLVVDLHDGTGFPSTCLTQSFFHHCDRLLLQEGMLMLNVLNHRDKKIIHAWLKDIFHNQLITIPIKKTQNTLFIAGKMTSNRAFFEVMQQINLVKRWYWDLEWGNVGFY